MITSDLFTNNSPALFENTGPVTHRIGLTVTDPNHPMVSKRGETIQKTVRVKGDDREAAINQAIAHYRRKGYKVHDHHYIGTVGQGVAEGKKPDNYHIVNKDGKPASLASYADRASAEKDRDEKHPGAEVRQVGPRGKVKNVSEVSLGDYRKKATVNKAVAQANKFFDRDDPTKVAAADRTIAKRERGLARADARVKPYTPPAQDAEKMQRDLTAKYPNIDELVAAAEQRRDPNYDYAEGNAYYDGREAEQNYQKLKQIQRVIQGLNESLVTVKKNYLYEGLDRSSQNTVKLWESAGQRIIEAQLTVDQINQLFKSAEQDATAAGGNRTMVGKGKDAATAVNRAWEDLKTKVQNSGPIKSVDAAYDSAAEKLKQATGGDQGVMKYVEKYRAFAKANPVAQSLIYSALIAAAGISGAGLGGAAALGLFKLVDKLLQGEKFSSAAYAGAKTGALAYGASKVADYFKGPKAPEGGGSSGLMDITGSQASQAQRAMYQAIEADPSLAKNAGALADIYYDKLADLNPNVDLDYLRSVADSAGMKLAAGVGDTATSAATNAAGDLARMAPRAAMKAATDQATQMINSGQITDYNSALAASDKIANALTGQVSGQTQEMIRSYVRDQLVATGQNGGWVQSAAQTAAQAASQNSGQLASQAINNFESREFHTSYKLTDADLYFLFSATTQLNEGIWDSIKGTAGKYAGKAADWAKTQGTNLTTKVTADKLKSAWLKAGSPTDSDQVYNVMTQAGVAPQILDTVYKTMDIPTFREKALARPTTPALSSAPIPAPKSAAPVAPMTAQSPAAPTAPAAVTPASTDAPTAPAAATGPKTKELGTGTGRVNPATGRPWTPSELKAKYAQPQPTAPTPDSEPPAPSPEPEPLAPKNSSDPFKAKRDAAALAAQQAMGDVASPAPTAPTPTPAPATTTPSGPPGFNAGNLAQLPGMSQSMQPKPAAPKPVANYGPGPAGYKASNFSVGPTATKSTTAAPAGNKPTAQQQQEYYNSLGLAEDLSWSKNFDPGRSLYRQIKQES
jgi:hypothetical protein